MVGKASTFSLKRSGNGRGLIKVGVVFQNIARDLVTTPLGEILYPPLVYVTMLRQYRSAGELSTFFLSSLAAKPCHTAVASLL